MGWGVEAILWLGRTVSAWSAATLAPAWGLAVFSLGLAWLACGRAGGRPPGCCPTAPPTARRVVPNLPMAPVEELPPGNSE